MAEETHSRGLIYGLRIVCLFLLAALALLVSGAGPLLTPARAGSGDSGPLGVASCAGSTCHGRFEADGEIVRQDELLLARTILIQRPP